MILEGSADIEVIKQYMNKIQEQVIRSTDLIHNVKTLYDLDDEKVKLRSIDLKEVIPKVLEYLKDGVREKNIKIDYEILQEKCFIRADDLVIDVLENLLLNAIKHNENDQIKIKIIVDNHNIDKSQFIRIQILDNARGIPDEMKKTLFNFKKDKKDYSRRPGIGLILVKKILDRYNGLIEIEDRILGDFTQGSNFILNIPAAN
jgi:two-component system CheB/CheR fusion protein